MSPTFKTKSRDLLLASTLVPMIAAPIPGFAAAVTDAPVVLAQAAQPGEGQPERKKPAGVPGPAAIRPAPESRPAKVQPSPRGNAQETNPEARPQRAAPVTPPMPRPAPAPEPVQPRAQPAPKTVAPPAASAPRPAPPPPVVPPVAAPPSVSSPAKQKRVVPVQPAPVPAIPAPAPATPSAKVQGTPAATTPNRPTPPDTTTAPPASHALPVPGQPPASRPAPGTPDQPRPAPVPPASAAPKPAPVAAPAAVPVPPPATAVPPAAPAPGQLPVGNRPVPPPPPPPAAPPPHAQAPGQPKPGQPDAQGRRRDSSGAIIAGAAAGFVGGFLAAQGFDRLDQVRGQRQQFDDGGVTVIREPGRTIIRQDNRIFVAHDENERFRDLGYDVRTDRQGAYDRTVYDRPDGSRVFTYTDDQGRLVRRVRQLADGREIILIDNRYVGPQRSFEDDVVILPPPPIDLSPDRYEVDAARADETAVYDALVAPPLAPPPRRYTLDQVRYSPDLRNRMRSVDLNTITFDTGSWTVTPDQAGRLSGIARAISDAVRKNPQEIFLIEGYTDAVGNDVDNLSLSDRRAQSVATILTQNFQVPPENLTTQGYGEQFLKVQTTDANAANRRVTVRRITPLLSQQGK